MLDEWLRVPDDRLGIPAIGLILLDLDGFKSVNDRFGHSVGDDVLVEVARTMMSEIRPGDIAVRLGGDEFLICLLNVDEYGLVFDRRTTGRTRSPMWRSVTPRVSASAGLRLIRRLPVTFDDLDERDVRRQATRWRRPLAGDELLPPHRAATRTHTSIETPDPWPTRVGRIGGVRCRSNG